MALNAKGYFNCLKSYLNTQKYVVTQSDSDFVALKEKVYWPGEQKEKNHTIKLSTPGDALIVKLDKLKDPLFHFLENDAKPWAKRCDFVVFHCYRGQIKAYCIEFKSASLPDSLCDQLSASESWCKALQSIIHLYTGKKRTMQLTKYVFSCHENPDAYLDEDNKYLLRDHSIRHYHYNDVNGMSLVELENENVERVT